jgi:hypothetical protein
MPTRGYQTITVKNNVFAKLLDAYEKRKRDLIMEDIKSYSAYAQQLLEFAIDQDIQEGRFKIISLDNNVVYLKDYYRMKDVEVEIRERSKVYCRLDQTGNCDHVGFVLANPLVIKRARELGVKLRKA